MAERGRGSRRVVLVGLALNDLHDGVVRRCVVRGRAVETMRSEKTLSE